MILLTILIVIASLQYWGSGGPLQQDGWFRKWLDWLATQTKEGTPAHLLLAVLPPGLLIGIVAAVVGGQFWGLGELILGVVVLLYSLGRGDLSAELADYLDSWTRGDFEGAFVKLSRTSFGLEAVETAIAVHRVARNRLYMRGFERLFAVLFWFLVLGPPGALVYRLIRLYPSDDDASRALRWKVLQVVDWIPARLVACGFSVIGDFERCRKQLSKLLPSTDVPNAEVLEQCGNAALGFEASLSEEELDDPALPQLGRQQLEAVEVLYRRSLVMWTCVLAVFVIVL